MVELQNKSPPPRVRLRVPLNCQKIVPTNSEGGEAMVGADSPSIIDAQSGELDFVEAEFLVGRAMAAMAVSLREKKP